MPREGDRIHIPLTTDEAIAGLLKVKPTADMPRMGKKSKAGKKQKSKRNPTK